MKKLLLVIGLMFVGTADVSAFRDVPQTSTLGKQLEHLVEKGVLKDHGFFRANSAIPAKMFWEMLLIDGGFNPESATFNTPLPANISEKNALAPFLREAIRRGFIDGDQNFIELKSITRLEGIKFLVKTKGIRVNDEVTPFFQKMVKGVAPNARFLNIIEAAYASKILNEKDIKRLLPYEPLSRRDFVRWLSDHETNGSLKISKIDVPGLNSTKKDAFDLHRKSRTQYPYFKRNKSTQKPSKTNNVQIEYLPNYGSKNTSSLSGNLKVFETVFGEIERKYRFAEDLTTEQKEKMVDRAIESMVKELGDKYTSYIEPSKVKDFKSGLEGRFEGIGAYVEMIGELFTITSPIKGSPAEKAGIEAGDVVKKVDDTDIKEMTTSEIIKLIKGPSGTEVKLDILRRGRAKIITVIRGKITVPSITLEWKKSIPIIGIHQFSRDTGQRLEKMIKDEVLPKNPRGIVFDLRNNPGGYLTSAVSVGKLFLNRGKRIFSVEYKDSEQVYETSERGILAGHKNLFFLQNKGSASASEILTSMIKDYEIGTILGEYSLGKGTVQEISNYSNGGTLKLTVAKWLSPKKNWIHTIGVAPDVTVANPTEEERKSKVDKQLDRAVAEALR